MIFAALIVSCAFPARFILEVYLTKYIDSAKVMFLLFAAQIFYIVIKSIYVNLYKAQKKQSIYFIKLTAIIVVGFVFNVICYNLYKVKESFAVGTLLSAVCWYFLCLPDFKWIKYNTKEKLYPFIQPYQQDMNLFNSNVLAAFEAAAITPELRDFRTQFEVNVQEMGDGMSAISDYVNGLTSQWDNALSYERLLTKQSKDGGYVNSIVDKTKMLQGQSLGEIKNQLKTLKEQTLGTDKHPYLSPDVYAEYESVLSVVENQLTDFSTKTADFQTRIQKEIEKKIAELQSDLLPDNVNNAIESSFQIGKEYSFSKMMEIAREGSFRYSEEIPPGYEDGKEKTGLQKYGDLFVWNQILDCAKSKQKDFIFVTNDVKIDWYEEDKRTPRFELLKEFREQANKRIWLLSMKNFIYHVNLLLDDQIHENVLQDIDSVQDEKENDKIRKELSADDIQKIFNNLIVKPIYVIDKIPKNESIRLFDNPDIYEAEDENGRKFRIITTIVGGGNYARVLHGMTNAFELKKLYETGNEHYWYYNFIIAKNEALVEKIMEHMGKTKVRKLFADHSIQTAVCYLNEDQNINIAKANFDI